LPVCDEQRQAGRARRARRQTKFECTQGGAEILPCVGGLIVCASRRWAAPATQDACHTEPDWIEACLWERFPIHLQGASATDATVARQDASSGGGGTCYLCLVLFGTGTGNTKRKQTTGDGRQETGNRKQETAGPCGANSQSQSQNCQAKGKAKGKATAKQAEDSGPAGLN
jgi:hypothetical protein